MKISTATLLLALLISTAYAKAAPDANNALPQTAPQISSFNDIPWTVLPDGRKRKAWFSDKLTMALWEAPKQPPQIKEIQLHAHTQEQITYILSGKALAKVGEKEQPVSDGGVVVVPGNVSHGLKVLSGKLVVLEVFTPVREDFRVPVSGK